MQLANCYSFWLYEKIQILKIYILKKDFVVSLLLKV